MSVEPGRKVVALADMKNLGGFVDSPSPTLVDTFPPMGQPLEVTASGVSERTHRNPVVRGLFFVLGLICLGLIPISYLPGIPTFDLVILAAFFFSMSSETMHNWMLNHRYFGPMIRGYRDHGLTMRMKWTAVIAIVASLTVSAVFLIDNTILRTILGIVGIYAVWFVFTRPTRVITAN